ncbi:ASKHA domain-containing protein, partial [Aerococcus urinae]|uniref:ASKHA domain-containing protein n=2 Tax=Aerococcus TaxID=1375 RepID=UPI00254ABFA4
LKASQLEAEQIDQVLVAGQFGRHLAEASLIKTGLLPEGFAGRLSYIGNSSHSGAYLYLMDQEAARGLEALARRINYIE